jgi:hypothetical protein
MSDEELKKYQALYSKFLEEVVNLHKVHILFLKFYGRRTKFDIHRINKSIITIQKELHKSSTRAYDEHRNNTKEKLANKRLERAHRKANPLKRGPKKKNDMGTSESNS